MPRQHVVEVLYAVGVYSDYYKIRHVHALDGRPEVSETHDRQRATAVNKWTQCPNIQQNRRERIQ